MTEAENMGRKYGKKALMGTFLAIIMVASSMSVAAVNPSFTKTQKNVVMHYTFPELKIDRVRILEKMYDIAYIKGLPEYGRSGEPMLPAKPVNILLPYGTKIKSIDVVASPPKYVGNGYFIEPRPEPIKIGDKPKQPVADPKIYTSSEVFPGKLYDIATLQYFRGFPIVTINLFPVQYAPKTGEIYYYNDMTLIITTTNGEINALYRGLAGDIQMVKTMVDNPKTVGSYPKMSDGNAQQSQYNPQQLGPGHYDYVIITSDALKNTPGPYNFSALVQSKINKGLSATIVTVEWINSTFAGVDLQEKIRNFIKEAYMNWGTEYVLLGGDADLPNATEHHNIVPVRYLWCSPEDADQNATDSMNIPSDMYYACLDGNYNSDNDSRWGEPTDGPGGSDVDLVADVYVGRAPVDNASEISNFVHKTLTYESSTDTYLNNATLFGEWLGFGGPADYSGNMMELLINGSNAHGFVTTGIPNEPPADGRYKIYTFFEKDHGGEGSLTTQVVTSRINNGTNIIAHSGHGNEDYVMNISAHHYYDGLAMLSNADKYFFAISDACDPGAFDNAGPVHGWTNDSIAEDLVTGQYGAFAVVMNARYGWGYGFTTDGPATAFQREFWNAIFGKEIRNLGKALFVGKEGTLWRLHMDCTRWTMYSENLLGDPEVEIKSPEVYGNDAGVNEIEHIKDGSIIGTGDNTVWARIENYGENSATIPVNYSVYKLHKIILFQDDMESGPSKWTVIDGNGDGDTWTILNISDSTRYNSPTHAFKCTANATYNANANDSLISQAIDCSGHNHVMASFYVWFDGQYDGWSGYLDYGSVYISDDGGLTWKLIKTDMCYVDATRTLSGIVYTFPVEAYVNLTNNVMIKFVWTANNDTTTGEGMYVDDVMFYTYEVVNRAYGSESNIALNAGEITTVNFTWNATTAGYYAINVTTKLAGDSYAHNNYKNTTVYAMTGKDIGVSSIISPTGLKATGTYNPEAKIANYGYADQTNVPVNCTIRDSSGSIVYTDVETISYLSAQKTTDIQFAPWTVSVEGDYTVNVTTLLPSDENPDNDYMNVTVRIQNIDDVATLAINYPTAGTMLGGYYKVNATVMNNGTTMPAFNVNCTIRDSMDAIVYSHEITGLSVQPGKMKYVEFPTWNATTEGDYTINVTTILATDEDPSNDYKEIAVTINNIDDVGATSINYPTGIQPTGSHIINATLENFGNVNKTNVLTNCSIYQIVPGSTIMTEGFEGYSPEQKIWPPAGWTVESYAPGANWTRGTAHDGDSASVEEEYGVEQNEWLITPAIDCSALSGTHLKFWHDFYNSTSSGDSYATVYGSIDNGATWSYVIANFTSSDSGYKDFDISSWADGQAQVKIAFKFYSTNGTSAYDYWYIDDVTIESVSSSTLDSQGFETWPPAGWTLDPSSGDGAWQQDDGTTHGPDSVVEGSYAAYFDSYWYSSGVTGSMITPSYDLSGLSNPKMSFWWWNSDGSDDIDVDLSTDGGATFPDHLATLTTTSSWTQEVIDLSAYSGESNVAIRFKCTSDYGFSNPHIDAFWIGSMVTNTVMKESFNESIPASGWPPAGWNIDIVSGTDTDNNWTISNGTSTHPSAVTPFGNYMAQYDAYYISSGNSARLYTSAIDFSTGSHHWLKFYMYHDSGYSSYEDKVVVQVSLDGSTWNDIATFMRYDASNPGWVQHMVDLSAYDGQPSIYIGFLGVSDYGNSIYIDNIEVGYGGISLIWSQEKNFDIPAYSTIYAEFGPWDVTTEGNYTIYVTTLMPGDENNTNNVTQTTVWIHNIYDTSVTAINYPVNGATYPTGSYPINATVSNLGNVNLNNLEVNCSIYKQLGGGYILSEDFEGAFPPAGWSVAGDPLWDRNDNWGRANYAGGNGYCADADSDAYGGGGDAYLMTPVLDLSSYSSATLSFTAAYNIWESGEYADVDISTNGGSTWINLLHWAEDHSPYGPGENVTIDLTPYVGNSNVVVRWHYYAAGWDYYYEIDNIRIFASGGMQLVYGEDKFINLNGGESKYVEFGLWNANEEASYTIKVTTLLPEDMDNTNNASTAAVIINDIPDAGATTINSPTGLIPTGNYSVNATIENFGNVNLSNVPVKCSIYHEAGGVTLLNEGFESGAIPSDWTVINEDGDGYQWEAYATTEAHSGDYVARVHWNSAGCDDWLITPQLSIPAGGATFSFWAKSYSSWYLEDFDIRLSTTGTNPSDFTTVLDSVTGTPYDWTQYSYDLSAYAGQNVYLAIRCTSVDEFYLYIDDVFVGKSGMPTLVYEDIETIPSLDVGESKYVEFAPWNADTEGNYIINVTTLLAGDENNANNASEESVIVKNIEDAAVVSINYPTSVIPVGNHIINVTLTNYGNYPASFDANCKIYGLGSVVVFSDDMESGINGWSHLATSGNDLWHITTSRYSSSNHSWYCGNETTGQYEDSMTDFLISPAIDLSGVMQATLTFKQWYDTEPNYDYAYVTASPDNNTFYILASYNGNSGGWVGDSVDITPYINTTTGLVNIGFIFVSDSSVHSYEGWYVDDVTITTYSMGAIVYNKTIHIDNLMPSEHRYVEFPEWNVSMRGDYTVDVKTMLAGDANPANDEMTKNVKVRNYGTYPVSPGTFTINSSIERANDTSVTITVTDNVSLSIYPCGGNASLPSPYKQVGPCANISVDNEDNVVWPIYIRLYYTQDDLDRWNLTENQIEGIFYWDGTSWKLYNNTGVNTNNISINGTWYEGYAWAYAYKGQLSPKAPGGADVTPPTSWISPSSIKNGIATPETDIKIKAKDDGLWYEIHYIINGRAGVGERNQPVDLGKLSEGSYTVEYWAVDAWGNEEQHHTITVHVMRTMPETTIAFDGMHEWNETHWQINTDTLIYFEVNNGGLGTRAIYYKVDDGNWTLFTQPFTLPYGSHRLYYYSIDGIGEIGPTASSAIDVIAINHAPNTMCMLSPSQPNGNNDWYVSKVTATLKADDLEGDGVTTYYRTDDGNWIKYTKPFVIGDGDHVLSYYSIDEHGNKEDIKTKEVKIDLYAPNINVEKPKNWLYIADRAILPLTMNKTVVIGKITITADIVDSSTSGVKTSLLYIDNNIKAEGNSHMEYTLDETMFGMHTIKIVAEDVAGNIAAKEIKAWITIYSLK